MKKLFKFLTSSKFLLAITLLINIAIFVCFTEFINAYIYPIISLLALLILIGFLNSSNEKAEYKVFWVVVIIVLPVFGTALYLQLHTRHGSRRLRKRYEQVNAQCQGALSQDKSIVNKLTTDNVDASSYSKYLLNTESWPIYNNTSIDYLKDGATYFDSVLDALKSAKKYVLLEYFIIKPGQVWDKLIDVLKQKAKEGIEIKLLYDDFGCIDRFNDKKYLKKLSSAGIETVVFNKISPTVNMFSQFRDHRKIVVVDGEVGFVGGINVGDEYANIDSKFGEWKDTAVRLEGDAVWNLVVMFFNNWLISANTSIDFENYKTHRQFDDARNEYVQPYGTGPLTKSPIARNLFDKMISGAKKSIYITTPYFIIDQTILQDLKIAVLAGVDINIIMPGIPDKKWVYYLSRSYYEQLISVGVKIYEYTPGFVHAKMMLVDDSTSIVGSTNFDFRSLYLHFESGVMMHSEDMSSIIKQDFQDIIQKSHLVTMDDVKHRKWYEKFVGAMLKFFAPFM